MINSFISFNFNLLYLASASSKDFYSSLSAIAGHDISEGNDGEVDIVLQNVFFAV